MRRGLWAALVLSTVAGVAHADDKTTCVTAYRQAQVRRKVGALRDAREQLLLCSREVCPAVVKADCVPWLGEVSRALPSVVVDARDLAGNTVSDVSVQVDDHVVASGLDGRPIDVDPGPHTLRFEAAGAAPVERRIELREGERERVVRVVLPRGARVAPPVAASPARPIPASAIAFAGIALAGGVGFGVFGALGNSKKTDLDICKPGCSPTDVGTVERDYIIADVSLGVGIVALGLATYFFTTRPTVAQEVAAFVVEPLPGGMTVSRAFRW